MADSKITALTALTAADPINDMLPIVDVSDTTMAASGTTKKISVNNILSSSPTASGALTVTGLVTAGSATITGAATVGTTLGVTGDLTVDTNVLKVDTTNNRVGIGTASPTAVLTVNGEISVTDNFALRLGSTQAGGATLLYNGSGNLDITPRSGFHTKLVDGNLIIGTSGKGIDFSAVTGGTGTATANVLNDYEEGTWTPSITFGGASVGLTGTFNGRYTKVGRTVTVNGIITLTAKGSSTGNAKLTGLPFTSANAAGEFTAVCLRLDRVSFTDVPCGYLGQNVTAVELENITNAGTVSNLTNANFINSSVLIWNFTYTV